MNRDKIIALLKKHGITVADDASLAQLRTLLAQLPATEQQARTDALAWLDAQPAPAPAAGTPPPAPAPAPAPTAANVVDVNALLEQMRQTNARLENERRSRITARVDELIGEDRVPANLRDDSITRAMADESYLGVLAQLPRQLDNNRPVDIVVTSTDPRNVVAHLSGLRKPVKSMLAGNDVSPREIQRHALALAQGIRAHREAIVAHLNGQVYGANTIDADLKRNVILNDIMRAFKRKIVMLNVFSTAFRTVPLEGTDKLVVPFYDLDTTTTKDFSGTYTFDTNTATAERSVTIDRRKYQPMNFTSSDLRRQPYFRPEINMMLKAEQLALDVWLDVLGLITASNYTTQALDSVPGSFDTDDLVDLRAAANTAEWPDTGRAAVLGTDYEAALLKDDALKHYLNSNSTDPLREGATGRLLGFEMFYSPRIPANAEDLVGFICLPQAVLVATSPILPAPGVRNQLLNYDVVIEPDLGIAFEYRYWGAPDTDNDREVVEVNYGRGVGNAAALQRIVDSAS